MRTVKEAYRNYRNYKEERARRMRRMFSSWLILKKLRTNIKYIRGPTPKDRILKWFKDTLNLATTAIIPSAESTCSYIMHYFITKQREISDR